MKWNLKKIIDFKLEKKPSSVRVLALKGLGIFLVLMILFTSLSRVLDTMTVPKVQTAKSEKRSLENIISTSGRVVQRKEQAISTVQGLKVSSIPVGEGQEVGEGDILFSLDLQDIQDKIEKLEHEIEKLEISIEDKETNMTNSETEKSIAERRGREDYNKAVQRGNEAILKAYQNMVEAWNRLQEYRQNGSSSGEEDTLIAAVDEKTVKLTNAQEALSALNSEVDLKIHEELNAKQTELGRELTEEEAAAIETSVQSRYSFRLNQSAQEVSTAQSEKEQAENKLNEYRSKNNGGGVSSEEQTLIEDYKTKADTYDSAIDKKQDEVDLANRDIENANKPTTEDNSHKGSQLEVDEKQKDLEKLKALLDQNGNVLAPVKGLITKVNITTGDAAPDGMSILMADTSEGTKFVADITEEQQKQLERKDKVTLKLEGQEKDIENLTIDMIQEKADDKSTYELTVLLPPGTLDIGKTAELVVQKITEPYKLCVPIEAVHQEDTQKYLLVIKETESILGTELEAERIDVTVLKSNDKYAAIDENSLSSDQKVIVSGTKEIKAGDRVRLVEE